MKQGGQKWIEVFRKGIVWFDITFHIMAALMLLVACGFIFYYGLLYLASPSKDAIIQLINDVLLALIVLELLWTVNRFLKRQKFFLGPFLAIGIIQG